MKNLSDKFLHDIKERALAGLCLFTCVFAAGATTDEQVYVSPLSAGSSVAAALQVKTFSVEGVDAKDAALALQAVGAVPGSYTVPQLRDLATALGRHWRDKGYLGARVDLPGQDVTAGDVSFTLVLGRVGELVLDADTGPVGERAREAVRNLLCGAADCTNVFLNEASLQHAVAVAGEIVGADVSARVKAGHKPGTADLVLRVEPRPAWSVQGTLDNYGVKSIGETRVTAHLRAHNLIANGAITNLIAGTTAGGNNTTLVIDHSQPLGLSAWRAGVQGFRGNVRLGGQFSALDASANANGVNLYAYYLLKRTADTNAALRFTLERTELETSLLGATSQRRYVSGQIMALGSADDRYLGTPATNRWQLALTHSVASGNPTTGAQGSANCLMWRTERFQWLPMGWRLDVSVRGQQATANLDTYNKMALGGSDGVRAYLGGEASGDSGWISRIDLAKHWGSLPVWGLTNLSTGVFYDAGGVRLNQRPSGNASANTQQRRGYGLQFDLQHSKNASLRIYWARADGRASSEDYKKSRVGAELKMHF